MAVTCGVGCRCNSDLTLLWLWYRPAPAAPIGPLAWELPYAASATLKSKQANKQTKNHNKMYLPLPVTVHHLRLIYLA